MSSTRGPGSPDPSQRGVNPQSKVEREEKQKVEKVGKVDLDEQRRKKFQQALEGKPKLKKEGDEEEISSPFDLELQKQKGQKEKELPMSDQFWSELSQPDRSLDQPAKPRQMEEKEEEKEAPLQFPTPLLTMPASIQPVVESAVSGVMSYLHPTTIALFTQMVGTMYVMAAREGVSETEVVLNHPSFANSPFYGSTIIIEKYDIAPDSFNIRLTGNEAAVNSFNENLPNLMNAFQNGKFNFRVNRIEAEYAPPIRRKEGSRGKGDKRGK